MEINNICTNGMVNCDGILGQVIMAATNQTTGSLFLTLFVIVGFFVGISILFGIRLEYTAIIILPLLLGLMAATSQFVGIGVVILIYLAMILTYNFILK